MGKDIPDFTLNYDKLISKAFPGEPKAEIRDEDYQRCSIAR